MVAVPGSPATSSVAWKMAAPVTQSRTMSVNASWPGQSTNASGGGPSVGGGASGTAASATAGASVVGVGLPSAAAPSSSPHPTDETSAPTSQTSTPSVAVGRVMGAVGLDRESLFVYLFRRFRK